MRPTAAGARSVLLVAAGVCTLAEGVGGRALLLTEGRVAWVGEPEDAPDVDRVVDLGAAWVAPGFVDAHVHATATGLAATGVDLTGASSAAECLARLRAHAQSNPDGVVLGGPWDDFGWPERGPPSAEEIGAAAPGRTVLLTRVDAHSCLVDPGTLAILPLADLEGVARDSTGQATGLLRERASEAAMATVRELLPTEQLQAARRTACERAAALGLVGLHEMGHPGLSGLDDALAWAAGDWSVEVLVWWAELDAEAGPAHGLRPGGDLFLDGSIGSHTAAVTAGYRDGGGTGQLFHDDADVAAFFTECTARGRGAGVHAIGDRAIEQATTALEQAAEHHGVEAVRACRHRVEHLELPTGGQLERLGRLGIVASVQPAFDRLWGGQDALYASRFGAPAAVRSNPFSMIADAGLVLAFGSDSTVTPLDPWGAVTAAEHHRGGLGVPRSEAIRAHAVGPRHAAGQDDAGALRPGHRADLTVWDGDPLTVEDPRTLRCLATVVHGRVAYGDLELAR